MKIQPISATLKLEGAPGARILFINLISMGLGLLIGAKISLGLSHLKIFEFRRKPFKSIY